MFLDTTGGNPICTEMNCHPPLHFHEEGFPTMLTLVKKSDTCANVRFLHVQILIYQWTLLNIFSALWECKVYKNTLSDIFSYRPQASFFLFWFFFCLSRITCGGWKAQKTACRSTVNPFLQIFGKNETGTQMGSIALCVQTHQPKSIAQKSVSGQSASSAQLGPDPINPVP